jgi:hypothetical protein
MKFGTIVGLGVAVGLLYGIYKAINEGIPALKDMISKGIDKATEAAKEALKITGSATDRAAGEFLKSEGPQGIEGEPTFTDLYTRVMNQPETPTPEGWRRLSGGGLEKTVDRAPSQGDEYMNGFWGPGY